MKMTCLMFLVAAIPAAAVSADARVEFRDCPKCDKRIRIDLAADRAYVNLSRLEGASRDEVAARAARLLDAAKIPPARDPKLRPLMGWSSWNTFGVDISETIILETARAMATNGLKDAGYTYVNIDDGFFWGHGEDGILRFHPQRFPNGMKPTVDGIHALGLKAGIYSDAGADTCGSMWGGSGSGGKDKGGVGAGLYGHDAADCKLHFNDLGFDFIKVDYCGGGKLKLNEKARYTEIANAIKATGRTDVRLNLCRWAFPGTWAADIAESWRTTKDIRANWKSVRDLIGENLYLSAYAKPGHYNDMDMLEVGQLKGAVKSIFGKHGDTGLTPDEEITHFGMWCMLSSPLLIGCDVRTIPASTKALITNPYLLAMNQNDLGLQGYVVSRAGDAYILVKDACQKFGLSRYVALYNGSDEEHEFTVKADALDVAGEIDAFDLVEMADVGRFSGEVCVKVAPHASKFYRIDAERRLMRTVYEAECAFLTDYQELWDATKAGTAFPDQMKEASGGVYVRYIGNRASNDLVWKDVKVDAAGEYVLAFDYVAPEDRSFDLSIDGGAAKRVATPGTAGKIGTVKVTVPLAAGVHAIRLSNATAWMPDLDRMTIALSGAAVRGQDHSACGPVVVLPDNPTAVERSAAKELADGLEKCLGKRPEIVSERDAREGRAPARPHLFVGATKVSAATRSRGSATLPAWEVDGVFLKSVKDGVVLDGDPARAPIYAVDLYLEKYCGVRWWTSDAATYPKLAAVPVAGVDLAYAPQFKYRETYYLDGFDPLFKVRSKGNFSSLTRYMLTDMAFIPSELGGNHRLYFFEGRHSAYHSFFEVLPTNTYFNAHPEWYSLIDGKRQPKQLCLANAEMKAEYVKETLKRLRADSSVDFIQVSQNDWRGYCQCEGCKAMMDEDGGAPSGPYLRFANEVAEAVEKEFPNVRIDTFAYQFTRKAPAKTRPRPNVVVRLCDIECDFARPLSDPSSPLNAKFAQDIADWKRVAGGNLFVWDYLANFWSYMLPHPNISQIAPNIRLFAENGAVGVFEQGDALCSAGSFATLRHYLAAHLLWDPGDDENRLMDEFLAGYYGKSAAPFLKKFIDVVENGPRKTKVSVGCGHKGVSFLTADDKLSAARLMDEAVAAAEKDGEPFAARVRRERLSVDHYMILNYEALLKFAARKKIPWTRPETRAEAVENWIRDVKAFGVKARRETTSADEIESYFGKLRAP